MLNKIEFRPHDAAIVPLLSSAALVMATDAPIIDFTLSHVFSTQPFPMRVSSHVSSLSHFFSLKVLFEKKAAALRGNREVCPPFFM